MPNSKAKYCSEYLTADQAAYALKSLPEVLLNIFGTCWFKVQYGWQSNIHVDLQYTPMRVRTDHMQWFIDDSVEQRIIVPGGSDLLLKSPQQQLILTYCHESDIHVYGEDFESMQQFMIAEPFADIRWLSQPEVIYQLDKDRRS